MSGKVQTYGRLSGLDGDKAYFQDGRVVSGIDSIIFCTGYRTDFSFLDLDVIQENGKMELYMMVFPINEKQNTLAFIGNVAGDFPVLPMYETQARLATRVMAGRHELPSLDKMKLNVDFWNNHAFARTGNYHSYFVSTAHLHDAIAQELGCYPSFWKIFWKNPKFAFKIWYGPILSAQFRLVGPDSQWDTNIKTCESHSEEGCSSLRHKDLKDIQRSDIYQDYRSQAVTIALVSPIIAIIGLILTKYGGENVYKTITSYFT